MKDGETQAPKTRGDQDAKAWASERAAEFGKAVQFWRKKLDLTAVDLSNRTREVGYPITRATIAKIESNNRNAKVDVAEVVALAAAMRIAPADLLFPNFPDGTLRPTPRTTMTARQAQAWFSGSEEYERLLQRPEPHSPMLDNTHSLRRAVEDCEAYIDGVTRVLDGAQLLPGPIEVEGAQNYEDEATVRRLRVITFYGFVKAPVWEGRLKEPGHGEG